MSVKRATPDDLDWVTELTVKGLAEIGQSPIAEYVRVKVLDSYQKAPCFILKDKGFFGLTAYTDYWSAEVIFTDYFVYLEPEHRNYKNLKKLVGAAKEFASKHDRKLRVYYALEQDLEQKERLLKMTGFDIAAVVGEYNE